jgi:RNA-directed DNA polymerase
MLAALEDGVKGGVWYSLMDKVYSAKNLRSAFAEVKANRGSAGVDHQTLEMFEAHLEANLERLSASLRTGGYRPQAIRRVYIPKPGKRKQLRPLGIPTVRDRVAQAAARHVLEPIFERDFAEHSYGFRPGRSCKHALRRVDGLLKTGSSWVVDADLKSYFDTIPHKRLMALVKTKVADGRVLALIEGYLKQEVLETASRWTPEQGSPQGAVLSPLLSNIYLDPLDHSMAAAGLAMVRYADDFVVLCRSESEARAALARVRRWTAAAGLTLHPEKTRIVDATQPGGFDFLGYHFERGYRWPSRKSLGKVRDAIRAKTRRCNGHSLHQIIGEVNPTLRGWYEYFKHSHWNTFSGLDGWVRMRLRSILRKRAGGRGRGKGRDHQRWPNAYFAAEGLFSLAAAHRAGSRPSLR